MEGVQYSRIQQQNIPWTDNITQQTGLSIGNAKERGNILGD